MQEETGAPLTSARAVPPPAPTTPSRLPALVAGVAALTAAADLGTKAWALAALTPGSPVPLLGRWFQLNLVRNPGAAFSMGEGATYLLTAVALVIVAVLVHLARTVAHRGWAACLGLILGGALGNLVDRFVREPGPGRGHVVDFLDYGGLFVGNVADIAIVLAAVAMVVLAQRGIPMSRPTTDDQEADRG